MKGKGVGGLKSQYVEEKYEVKLEFSEERGGGQKHR